MSSKAPHSPLLQQVIDTFRDVTHPADNDLQIWGAALAAADAASLRVLVVSGAVAETDEFYKAVSSIAEHFGFSGREREFNALTDNLADGISGLVNEAGNAMEAAKWRGAYALGLAVGLRIAGGAR